VFQFSTAEPSPDKNIHVIDWANPVTDYKVIREVTFEVLNELGTEEFLLRGSGYFRTFIWSRGF